jgi:peptidyl-Lys metalloendopeptidase
MPAPSTPANPPAPGAAAPVAVALSVAPLGAGPAATVRFTNTSGRPFPLARYLACQGETLEHNVFTITDADAKRVPYVGPMIKRAAPGDADFITLAPGQSLEGTVRLDAAYALAASKGPFRVRYSAFNPSHAPWPLTKLESPEVPFDWRP